MRRLPSARYIQYISINIDKGRSTHQRGLLVFRIILSLLSLSLSLSLVHHRSVSGTMYCTFIDVIFIHFEDEFDERARENSIKIS